MTNITVPHITATAERGRAWKWMAGGIGAVVVVVLVLLGSMLWRMSNVPADLDFSTTRASEHGVFKATIRPAVDPIPINTMHHWTLHVVTPDGKPVENATITLQGDMPQHGHGMPTNPEVSTYLGNGDYGVDGMRFQMTGWWVVDFDVSAGGQRDRVSFNLLLK
jgi:hypothetical protein